MSNLAFYRERAAECGRDADASVLDNVRERALRAQAAWLQMAARAERGDAMREQTAREKAGAQAEY